MRRVSSSIKLGYECTVSVVSVPFFRLPSRRRIRSVGAAFELNVKNFGLVRLQIDRKLVASVLAVNHEVVFFVSGILDHERGLAWFQARRHVDFVVRQRDVNAPRIWIGSDGTDDFVNDFFGAFDYFVSDIFGGVDRVLGHVACFFDWRPPPRQHQRTERAQ